MKSSSKIRLHPLTLLICLVSLLTGYFKYIFCIFFIILVHELGHVVMAKLFGRKILSIELLPFGGLTRMEGKISDDIFEDLLIAVGGIFFQTILGYVFFAIYNLGFLDDGTFEFISTYNTFIIGFNLVPICPLDGYKIVKSLVELIVPYKISYICTLTMSILFLGASILFAFELIENNIFVFAFLIFTIIEEFKMRKYALAKFYVERMTYDFYYSRIDISKMKNMFKNRTNYIKDVHEKEFLKAHFTMNRD